MARQIDKACCPFEKGWVPVLSNWLLLLHSRVSYFFTNSFHEMYTGFFEFRWKSWWVYYQGVAWSNNSFGTLCTMVKNIFLRRIHIFIRQNMKYIFTRLFWIFVKPRLGKQIGKNIWWICYTKKAMPLQKLFHPILAGVANETMPGNIYHNYGDMQQSFEMRKLIEI